MRTIIHNGKIYIEKGCFADALIIDDDVITLAGCERDIMACCDTADMVYDCGGKTVLPGFNDSHMHIMQFAEMLNEVRIDDVASVDELINRCRDFACRYPDRCSGGIHACGWNQELFTDDPRIPDRHDLDRISTDIPIILERVCGHIVSVNTKLIQLLGLDENSPQYPNGEFVREPGGFPSGVFKGNACMHAGSVIPALSIDEKRSALIRAMKHAASMGITSIQSNDIADDFPDIREAIMMLQDIFDNNEASVRYHYQMHLDTFEEFEDCVRDGLILPAAAPDVHDMWLTPGPLKLYKDGSLGAGTAYLRSGYADDRSNKGLQWLTSEEMDRFCTAACDHGIQVITHAIGDKAIQEAAASYEKAFVNGVNKLRHGIVHCQITDSDLIETIRRKDILVFAQPVFIDSDMHIVDKLCGDELASSSYAFGTMLRQGIHLSYGTDCPVETCDPFLNIYEAVTRKDKHGYPATGFYPDEAVDVAAAIDAYTLESAYAQFAENVKGRLKPGFAADLVVLDKDIFTVDADEIKDIRPVLTMTGGRIVYQR